MRYSSSGRLSVKCQGQLQTKVLSFPIQCFFYRFAYKSQWVLGRSRWTSILSSSFLSVSLPNFPQVAIRALCLCQEVEILVLVLPLKVSDKSLMHSGPHVDHCYDEIKFILLHFMARQEKFKHDVILCVFGFPLSPLVCIVHLHHRPP